MSIPDEVLQPQTIQKLRQQYPQYHDMSDAELSQKIVKKYPQYRDLLMKPTPDKPAPKPKRVKGVSQNPIGAIGGALEHFQSDVANLPGVRDVGDIYRRTLGAPQPVRISPMSPEFSAITAPGSGFSADESGNLYDSKGNPITTNQLQFMLGASIPAGASPGSKLAQQALRRAFPGIISREGGLIQEHTSVRGAVERGVHSLTGVAPEAAVSAHQSAADIARAARQGLSVLPDASRAESGPTSAPHTPPPTIQPPGSTLLDPARRDAASAAAMTTAARRGIQEDARASAQVLAQTAASKAAHPPLKINIPLNPAVKTALQNEQGGVNLKPISDYLDRQHQVSVMSGDIGDQLNQISRQADASGVEVRQIAKGLGTGRQGDWEAVYHAMERPESVKLTPQQQALYQAMDAIRNQTEEIKLTLPTQLRPITGVGYVRRFPIGVGSLADRARAGISAGRGNILRRTTSAFRHRQFVSLTDDSGKMIVASRDGDRLIGPDGKFLGTMARARQDAAGQTFRGRDGVTYKLGNPSTQEIEAQTGQRYYKNALFSTLLDHQETMQIARANNFLEHLKTDQDFLQLAAPADQAWQRPGWVHTKVPQFYNWVMEPKVAAALDAAMPTTRDAQDIVRALRSLSQFSINVGFINPLIHTPNVGTNWAIDRGAARWINPMSYKRLVVSGVRAWNASAHINDDYLAIMREGGAVMQENGAASKVRDALLSMARQELQENPQLIEGMTGRLGRSVGDIINAPYWLSHRITWLSNDFAYLQRVYERQLEGATLQDAIRQTERFIPNYRLPPTILGSTDLSRVLRDRGAVIFAPYHYGVLKSWGQIASDLVGRVPMSRRLEAADKLAMAGILLFGVAPAMDHVFQELTGNPRARARRPGLLAPVYNAMRVQEGTLKPEYAVESMVSPSPLVGSAIDIAENTDRFSSPVQSLPEKATAFAGIAAEGLAPLSIRQMIQSGSSIPQTLLGPVVTIPKRTPAESAIMQYITRDSHLRQAQINGLMEQGDDDKARRLAHTYNERLRRLAVQAARDQNDPDPVDAADQFVRVHGLKILTTPAASRKLEQKQQQFTIRDESRKPTRGPRTYERAVP